MSKPNSFFRGQELPRLLLLMVILAGGMVFLWQWVYLKGLAPPPEPVAVVPITPIVPDKSPEFETVKDKSAIGLRDMAAYRKLLEQAEKKSPASLAKESRNDVLSIQIWENPKDYRGVPIHILGTALRVMTYTSKHAKSGRLYEAWVVTSDSQRNPYICVFEDAPKGFPIGDNISERIVFNGYFLKLMTYQSAKDMGIYFSPVLIGRVGWTAEAAPQANSSRRPILWMALAVGMMFVLSFIRWMTGLRKSLSLRNSPSAFREKPNDQISPEALAAWAESVPEQAPEEEEKWEAAP